MTIEKKYNLLLHAINKMDNKRNYYTAFAAFGDSLPKEIWKDVKNINPNNGKEDNC